MNTSTLVRRSCIGLVIAVVVAAHLLSGLTNTVLEQEIRNALHVIGFAIAGAVFFELLPGTTLRTALLTLALVLGIGLVAELAQFLNGRMFGPDDVLRDVAGAACYLLARLIWPPQRNLPRQVLAVCVALLVIVPLVQVAVARQSLVRQFPLIADFDSGKEALYIRAVNADLVVADERDDQQPFTGHFARVTLLRRNWSGLEFESVSRDWSGYSEIVLTVRIEGGDAQNQVRVFLNDGPHVDSQSQHLVASERIGSASRELRVPLRDMSPMPGRPALDLANIERAFIIARTRQDGATLVLDNVRLE